MSIAAVPISDPAKAALAVVAAVILDDNTLVTAAVVISIGAMVELCARSRERSCWGWTVGGEDTWRKVMFVE